MAKGTKTELTIKEIEGIEQRRKREEEKSFRKREKESKAEIKYIERSNYVARCGWLNGFGAWEYGATKEAASKALFKKLNKDIEFLKRRKAEVKNLIQKERDRKKKVQEKRNG